MKEDKGGLANTIYSRIVILKPAFEMNDGYDRKNEKRVRGKKK